MKTKELRAGMHVMLRLGTFELPAIVIGCRDGNRVNVAYLKERPIKGVDEWGSACVLTRQVSYELLGR